LLCEIYFLIFKFEKLGKAKTGNSTQDPEEEKTGNRKQWPVFNNVLIRISSEKMQDQPAQWDHCICKSAAGYYE
jgi:hypothetical protein